MNRWTVAAVAVAALTAGTVAYAATAPPPPTTVVAMKGSRFLPGAMTVKAGTTVRFEVTNLDPIDHELIIGPTDVQDRHEKGSETHHADKPGEVSVAAGETRTTTYRFAEPGEVTFGCHLPGHYSYGMKATVTVTP